VLHSAKNVGDETTFDAPLGHPLEAPAFLSTGGALAVELALGKRARHQDATETRSPEHDG